MTAIMCGRFTASFEFREIKVRYRLQSDLRLLPPRYNIAPSQEVPVIIQNREMNELQIMRWGLVPSWAPDRSIVNRMINARAESITEKASFRRLIESRRCLIPADGFYEWRDEGSGKVPVWFHLKKKEPFAFAPPLGCVARRGRGDAAHVHNHHDCAERIAAPHSQPNAGNARRIAGETVARSAAQHPRGRYCRGACAVSFRADGVSRCFAAG
jgi:SOS response associated peptidase (SRAP)